MADSRATSRVVYILLVNLLLCLHIRGKRTLKFVSLLYRHGDRTPYDVYGNDTNTEDTWPQGFMQLTRVGIQQQYELGQFLRSRYVGPDFLNSSYSRYQHDATVASLLSALGTFNYIHPPYCACVMVELHQEDSGEFFVEVWYRSDSGHDPYLLTVPGCPDPCSYQQFLNATKDSIVTDREKECQLRIVDMLTRRTSIIVVGVVLVIILFVVVVIWICVRRSRRSHQHSHNLISEENISLTSTNDDDNEDETA
uniref:Acid phosphatase n=1 Tax=Branchiostoma floridae TaxID=7739 RepID=C3Y6Z4_BRAFL|eukprot:XP_002608094.1 hypothetical protein BRAFLDRAFT_91428 [Branchiostoma floridae]